MKNSSFFDPSTDDVIHWGRIVLAILCVVAALLRIWCPLQVDWQFLLFLLTAGVLLMLPHLKKFQLNNSGGSLEFGNATDREAAKSFGIGGKGEGAVQKSLLTGEPSDDPQKGEWGGSSFVEGYELIGQVESIPNSPEWFRVQLEVRDSEPVRNPGARVQFHLHPTFRRKEVVVPFCAGVAVLDLVAWGAFTVGAEVFDAVGKSLAKLELDLATLENAPMKFRSR